MLVYSNWQRGLTQIQDVAGSNPAASTSVVNNCMTEQIDESIKDRIFAALLAVAAAQQCDAKLVPTFHSVRMAHRNMIFHQAARHNRKNAGFGVSQPSIDPVRHVWD